MEKNRAKILRGDILEFLYTASPSLVKEGAIVSAYYEYHTPADIRRSLAYLADSKLIAMETRPHPIRPLEKVKYYKIAPEGVNLVEHSAEDVGVLVVGEEDIDG
jgi:hypothetical protein